MPAYSCIYSCVELCFYSQSNTVWFVLKSSTHLIERTSFHSCLIQPMEGMGTLAADSRADFYLLDRVINVMPNGAVPYKLKGTVVGIHGG